MLVRNKTTRVGYLDISNLELDCITTEMQGCPQNLTSFIDISHNNLSDAGFLRFYFNASCLNADYNSFEKLDSFPKLPNLDTLTLNFNSIDNINEAVRSIAKKFPELQHLSLIQNPCCPFLKINSTEAELRRYRLRIISRLTTLLTLDGSPINDRERFEAEDFSIRERSRVAVLRNLVDLPSPKIKSNSAAVPSHEKVRQSEGNKFISNEDL